MKRSLRTFALASVAASAAAAGIVQQDAEALLQVGATVEGSDAKGCGCLKWEHVYTKLGAKCGDGRELPLTSTDEQNKSAIFQKFCMGFYNKLYGAFCPNIYFETQRTEQWCYVSAECEVLNGGGAAGGLKWKVCTAKDALMRAKTPQQLMKLIKGQNKDAGLVLKLAFPTYEGGLEWPDVQKCLKGAGDEKKCAEFERVQAAKNPMVFNSNASTPPFGFITDKSVMELHYNEASQKALDRGEDLSSYPGQLSDFVCRSGCSI